MLMQDLCVSIAVCLRAQPFAPRESVFKATDFVESLFVIERGVGSRTNNKI